MAGKGDKPRPIVVDRKQFETNWERTFGNNKKEVVNEEGSDGNDGSITNGSILLNSTSTRLEGSSKR